MHSRLTLPLALLVPVMLVVGLLIGVNADKLPGPIRDALGSSDDQAAVEQAIDLVNEKYYRKISKDDLANKAIGGMVKELDDKFSHNHAGHSHDHHADDHSHDHKQPAGERHV